MIWENSCYYQHQHRTGWVRDAEVLNYHHWMCMDLNGHDQTTAIQSDEM